VHVQLLALNDLHGNLEPPQGSAGTIKLPDDTAVETGGAAHLAARVAALRAENPNTVVVSAGDLIGASPLMSALFHDEPTIEVMNQIGLAYNAVGNHEFDDGKDELLRMQAGGCHPEGCGDDTPFPGASFQFLAANVLTSAEPTETLFPSYVVHEVGGARIGFIGMTLEGTPAIVTPAGVEGLTFVDEADRANALVPDLLAEGVSAIVLLIHEGGYPTGYYDECPELSGPIVEIVERLDPEIDVVVSGHTHQAYNCVIADRLVTSAASFGRVLTDIDLEISVATGDVTAATAKNVLVTRDDADPDVAAFVAMYKDLAAPLANKPIGEISATLERYPPMMKPGLSTMGAVIADAQLAATADVVLGGAQIAFMNPGGVRADLVYEAAPEEAADGIVTYGEAFTVQPFGNSLVVMTLTGAQIEALLEQQFVEGFDPKILQVSAGFTYTYSEGAPVGDKIEPSSILLDGEVVDPAQSYRVTVNSFMASGGDGFTVLVEGADRLGGANDLDALADYFATASPVDPPALDRLTVVP
jgi:5'-nucleotidase